MRQSYTSVTIASIRSLEPGWLTKRSLRFGFEDVNYKAFPEPRRLLGPSTNSSDQRGFQNEESTLFGINHMQVNDVNERVAKFLDEPFSSTALSFLRIESISGTTVRLQTVDFRDEPPYPEKELLVNVDKDGGITLLQ